MKVIMQLLGSCWPKSKPAEVRRKKSNLAMATDDIVYIKIYEQAKYKLDVSRLQIWVFDKNLVVLQANVDPMLNKHPLEHYLGRSFKDFRDEDQYSFWWKILKDCINNGNSIKHTMIFHKEMVFVETKPMFNEGNEGNDGEPKTIIGCMLIIIPYLTNMDILYEKLRG